MSGDSDTSARDFSIVERIAALVLPAITREYPNHLMLLASSDADLRPPRELTPAFFGSFDWHSSVHGHWCLARLARCHPRAGFVADVRAVLARSLSPERITGELAFLMRPERAGFERPYGLAWLLQLGAEMRQWGTPEATGWRAVLAPLEALAIERLAVWLPRLRWPIRSGEHAQTAFALGLALDAARAAHHPAFARLIEQRAHDFFAADQNAPIEYEPSGHDFLSPALGEADLMRRVLPPSAFETWFERFLPDSRPEPMMRWLTPVVSTDRADGKLAHLDGLNLSRAWMLEGIAASLPGGHPSHALLTRAGQAHREAGLAALAGDDYAGTHWLGSFAAYLITRRGMPAALTP